MRQFHRTGYTRAETDAVIGPRHVVIHRFGDGYHIHSFLMQSLCVTQSVITSDSYQIVDVEELQIVEDFRRQVVDLGCVPIT